MIVADLLLKTHNLGNYLAFGNLKPPTLINRISILQKALNKGFVRLIFKNKIMADESSKAYHPGVRQF